MAQVFMFPGQGAADPQMVVRALALHAASRDVAERAAETLGAAEMDRYLDPHGVPLQGNRDVQVSVFLATQMHLAALRADGIEAEASLGLSLGEYSHLVHIGALAFEEALRLVDARGRAYDAAGPGATAGVREQEHGAQTANVSESRPTHSPLMSAVARRFRGCLERAPWRRAARPYVPNVTGDPMVDPQPLDLVDSLAAQVACPVRWQRSVERLARACPAATFVEVGPGTALRDLLGRRGPSVRRAATDAPAGVAPAAHFRATVAALSALAASAPAVRLH